MIGQSLTRNVIMKRAAVLGAGLAWSLFASGCSTEAPGNADPNLAAAYSHAGQTDISSGNYDAAIADCSKAIAMNPDEIAAYSNRGIARQSKGDFDGAIADYNKAMGMTAGATMQASLYKAIAWANIHNALVDRGNIRQTRGDLDGAIADYNRAIELCPHDEQPWAAYAYADRSVAWEAKGNHVVAVADRKKAVELDPNIGPGLVSMTGNAPRR